MRSQVSRRSFLGHAASALALPALVPASALGRDGTVAPSNRIVMGTVGMGGRGTGVLQSWVLPEKDVQVVAHCDVWKLRRDNVKNIIDRHYGNHDCKAYLDMKEMFARGDLDAIYTATGDRWHAGVSITAMRAGIDVYTEKPASMTVQEGQAVVATARKYKRVYQAGMQRLSEPNFVVCNELLKLGRLGEVKKIYAHLAPWGNVNLQRNWLAPEPQPAREVVDWDAWLGPCPWRPYNHAYLAHGWSRDHDLYTGVIGEWGSHTFAQCHDAINMENASPVHYTYLDSPLPDGMTMRFANGIEMVTVQSGWHGTCGVRYVGSEGWVSCADGYSRPEASKPSLLADYDKILADYCVRTGYTGQNHMRQFFNSVKSRAKTVANPVMMHRSMTTVHCANICEWLGRDMDWDPVKEQFINDPEANRMLARAQREGWQFL